jgi:hypothetical protein
MANFTRSIAALAIAIAITAPLQAQQTDFGDFLAGRWGDATAEWKDQTADWIYAPCNIRHPRSTAAYEFSGKANELTVRTTGEQGQATRKTPVVSPVMLAGPFDASQSPEFKNARIVVGIAFERVGYMVPKENVGGMLVVIDDDRMVLLEPSTSSPETVLKQYLVRCRNR